MSLAPWPARFDNPEAPEDEGKERDVNHRERALAGLKEHQPVNPVLEERALVGARFAGQFPEPGFPRRQRTINPAQGFASHDRYGQQMGEAKPEIAYPRPAQESSPPHRQQTDDDESDEGEMDDEDDVGSKKIELGAI